VTTPTAAATPRSPMPIIAPQANMTSAATSVVMPGLESARGRRKLPMAVAAARASSPPARAHPPKA